MCQWCKITNREAAVLGKTNLCDAAPADTPRGGAGPRVSDGQLKAALSGLSHVSDHDGASILLKAARDSLEDRATIADLRAKLAEAEREQTYTVERRQHWEAEACREHARANAAEAALRKVTEERDRAWEAGRDAAASLAAAEENEPRNGGGWSEGMTDMARQLFHEIRALTPPAETAVEEGQ